ncbi:MULTISPECIES: M56 family metallopeptidase [Pseudonocardia]|uniref:Protease HtpX n=2 Tax=Pseudonocardia TaxID=1847 RepID=A0A1Y2N2T7_PSEAH|nr:MULTISPECIES: M56 family metallopeptidase [Pseudonocardia]OSY41479.1 Protease HtpX [Pseudonocardia autotrophica]TDN71435.1 Zn-dependent protease with chaperone function [Pseudonocardia autotrophica]BBG02111.1 integral membrane protein [Pseudonocardia autotrophica]GEC24125.1 integral membrane protein [Pseudonocardia saturnea]
MELTALGLGLLGLILAEPVSRMLARARWPARDPVGALLLWQAVGLGGGISLFGAGLAYGLAPLGDSLPAAASVLTGAIAAGDFPEALDPLHVGALLIALGVLARLLSVLVITTVRTLRARRRHRDLLDVLATPWPFASGTRVLDHPVPVAYCLPGRSSRLVVSAGVLDALDTAGVVAVLAHERAHLRERHDLVVLPFVAWGATAPFVRGMVAAQLAVARLIEMRADDVARRLCDPTELATALKAVGGSAPAAALSSFTDALDARIDRITAPPTSLPVTVHWLVRVAAVALVALPLWALLSP